LWKWRILEATKQVCFGNQRMLAKLLLRPSSTPGWLHLALKWRMHTTRLIIQNQHVLFLPKELNGGACCQNGMHLHRCSTAVGRPTNLALIIEAC
jgi:hypothetical protein